MQGYVQTHEPGAKQFLGTSVAAQSTPDPQASTLPPLVTHARIACIACEMGLLRIGPAWYLRSALSMKCC